MKPLLWIALPVLVLSLGWRLLFGGGTTSWHQRLTITIETPAGEVSASSVTGVTKLDSRGPLVLPQASGVRSRVHGEAVAVEVLPGRWLFALLSGDDGPGGWQRAATHWVYPAYALEAEGSYEASMRKVRRQPSDTPVPLPPEGWPMMVTFGDIADPTSVARVDPDDLAATFGPGVRLKAVTLEITRVGVTEGATLNVLPWLKDSGSNRLDGQRFGTVNTDNPFANSLAAGLFTTKIKP